jgi:hypothetical protein
MPKQDEKFRFLTMDEFNGLTRKEKAAYLEGAAAEITKQQLGDAPPPSLFKNGPPTLLQVKKPIQRE